MPGVKRVYESDGEDLDQETTSDSEISNSGDTDSTSETCNNEDTESTSGFSSGGDDADNDNDNRSSVMDDEECEKRLKDCLSQMTELENEFIRLKDELKKFWKENKTNMRLMKRLCGDFY